MGILFRLLALLSLARLHRLGAWLGRLAYAMSARFRRRIDRNLRMVGLDPDRIVPELREQLGMQALETAWVWYHSNREVAERVETCAEDRQKLHEALARGKPVIFLLPHMGNFESAPVWLYENALKSLGKPIHVLYRIPRKAYIRAIVASGRDREGMVPVTADLKGVRTIVKVLREGGILGCLPDQVPGPGMGRWVPFFGKDAYTMTLPMKMAMQHKAVCVVAWSKRIPGKGWRLGIGQVREVGDEDLDTLMRWMNDAVAEAILQAPEQYPWNYKRYKAPSGMDRPEQSNG